MYEAYLYNKFLALAFFISLIIIGQMILLNLFLAVLLENFSIGEENGKGEKKNKKEIIEKWQNWLLKNENE